jgi:putative ABC transport system permease protein
VRWARSIYENARIIAGRALDSADENRDIAVVGRLYAQERLGISATAKAIGQPGKTVTIDHTPLQVVGIYSTGNDFGDNHVFVPIERFRRILNPGGKLSKIRVTVDSIDNVEAATEDLKRLKGVDSVTAAEQVATAKATLGSIAAASFYGSLLLFAIGGVLVIFIMVLTTRERINEIGTLKAIGASNAEVVKQFIAEVLALTGLAAVGAIAVAALSGLVLRGALNVDVHLSADTFILIVIGGLAFAVIGSCYPILKGIRLSPVQAMKGL